MIIIAQIAFHEYDSMYSVPLAFNDSLIDCLQNQLRCEEHIPVLLV